MPPSVARIRRLALVLVAVGVAVAVAATAAGLWLAAGAVGSAGAGDDTPTGAVDGLVAAWRRHLEATWLVEGTFERVLTDGESLSSEFVGARRPPDRLSVAFGSVDARRGGEEVACGTDPQRGVVCRSAPAPRTFQDEVEEEMDDLAPLVVGGSGTAPLYDVSVDGSGCFALDLAVPGYPAPPYGRQATFCFDDETGAPTRSVIEREEGTDRRVATSVTGEVSDADLDPERYADRLGGDAGGL